MTRVKTEKISIDATCETIINPPSPLVRRRARAMERRD